MENQAEASEVPAERIFGGARHHLLIAGTGRSGTSFLVRFLAAMGLETHLATADKAVWHEDANAGLEDIPLPAVFENLPYVIKTPFLSEIVDDVLRDPAIVIDAVIIPVRDLVEAAASRTVMELQAIHQREPWMATVSHIVENWGVTPGGTLYSLNPVDQGRLLAVGFHQLIQRLTVADIVMVFLDFPRLAKDPAYLFAKLRSLLPADATAEQAATIHAQIADATKIRIGNELRGLEPEQRDSKVSSGPAYPDLESLDLIATRRELVRLRTTINHHQGSTENQQRLLGQRESAMGEREIAMANREQSLQSREEDLTRKLDDLAELAKKTLGRKT